jgi:hypothetical protein
VRLENNSKEVYASNKVPAYVSLVPWYACLIQAINLLA